MREALGAVTRLAASQQGVVSRAQVLSFGISVDSIDRLLKSGAMRRFLPKVYSLWTPSDRWRHHLFGATLWLGEGSAVSHRAASVLRRLDGVAAAPIEVSTESRRRTHPGIVVHHVRSLPREDIEVVEGLSVTTVERTLVDLAGVARARVLELALESAFRRELITERSIEEQLARVGRASGSAILCELLDRRGTHTESQLETMVWQVLRNGGLPLPQRQYWVTAPGGRRFRIDFAYPEIKLAIEAVGYESHSKPADWQRDNDREKTLILLGWKIFRVTWEDVTVRPAKLVSDVAELLSQAAVAEQRG